MFTKENRSRSCGECSECCTVVSVISDSPFNPDRPEVPIWYKPVRKTCEFVSKEGKGCTIFDKCPKVCRAFTCEWLRGEPVRKPTESGVVFFINKTDISRSTMMVAARTDEDYNDEETRDEIRRYRSLGYPVVLVHDKGRRTLVK